MYGGKGGGYGGGRNRERSNYGYEDSYDSFTGGGRRDRMGEFNERRGRGGGRFFNNDSNDYGDRRRGFNGGGGRGFRGMAGGPGPRGFRGGPRGRGGAAYGSSPPGQRGSGFRGRGDRGGFRGRDRERREAPASDVQKSGAGKIWYAGPRCSLIQDNESKEYIFMYNDAMQPKNTTVKEKEQVIYGAFYDEKFIKKHDVRTKWEAAWVELFNEEDEDEYEEVVENNRDRSRSPFDK